MRERESNHPPESARKREREVCMQQRTRDGEMDMGVVCVCVRVVCVCVSDVMCDDEVWRDDATRRS